MWYGKVRVSTYPQSTLHPATRLAQSDLPVDDLPQLLLDAGFQFPAAVWVPHRRVRRALIRHVTG
jgi:hypothetical protein